MADKGTIAIATAKRGGRRIMPKIRAAIVPPIGRASEALSGDGQVPDFTFLCERVGTPTT